MGTGANNILAINDSAGWGEEGFVARLDAATGLALNVVESNGQSSYPPTFGVPDVPEQGKELVLLPPYDDEIIGGGFFSGRVNINTFTLEAPSPSTTPVVGQTNRDGFVFRLPYPR